VDSTFSEKLFFICNVTTAFSPLSFGGETFTTSCALAVQASNDVAISRIIL